MKRMMVCIGLAALIFLVSPAFILAENEIREDKEAIKEQKQEMKEEGAAAKQEEKAIKAQINTAVQSGDKEQAYQLRRQLKATHRENVQERVESKQDMRNLRKDLKQDVRDARQQRRGGHR